MSDELHFHRIRNLVNGLISRTEDENETERLKWEAIGHGSYELSLSRSSLRIASEHPEGDWYPYKFSIVDENGNEIEEVYGPHDQADTYRLADLFSAASRSHRGVSEKLTEVFTELGIADPPPQPVRPDPWGSAPTSGSGGKSDDEPPF
jgi:hypothetical protein